MKNEYLKIPCGAINLEAEINIPDVVSPSPAVIICHPHPLYGGDMQNNVVTAIYNALKSISIAVLRFNFRGVGGSGGTHGGGIAEKEDVKAVFEYLASRPEIDKSRIGLAGYSFGGGMAYHVALDDKRAHALCLISPMLQAGEWSSLSTFSRPKLVLIGSEDSYISPAILEKWFSGNKDFIKITGADHFWQGFEDLIQQYSVHFFQHSLL